MVFTTELGTPFEGRNLTRTLHRVLREAGIERLGVHALRHTFAARAVEAGMDVRTLSEIPGHANIALALQLYAHLTTESKRNAMKSMEVFLWKNRLLWSELCSFTTRTLPPFLYIKQCRNAPKPKKTSHF